MNFEPKQRAHSSPKVPPISMAGGLAAGLASKLKTDYIHYGRRFPVRSEAESFKNWPEKSVLKKKIIWS